MKVLFVSDIHGNVTRFDEVLQIYETEKADKLVLLGDTSSMESTEDNLYIATFLNQLGQKVEVIRGNCDTYDFEHNLKIPMFDVDNLFINGLVVTITHGNRYHFYHLPEQCGNVFIQGHTHIPLLRKQNGIILANPGSISRPRGSDLRCYIIIENHTVFLKTTEGTIIAKEECN